MNHEEMKQYMSESYKTGEEIRLRLLYEKAILNFMVTNPTKWGNDYESLADEAKSFANAYILAITDNS